MMDLTLPLRLKGYRFPRVARQSETEKRDNQARAATKPHINPGLHRMSIVSFERTPVKPGLSGHRLRRLRA
jgi:hypothetical protein